MPAHYLPGVQIHNGRQIQPAFSGLQIRDVTHPHLIRPGRGKVLVQQIWGHLCTRTGFCRDLISPALAADQAVFLHQLHHPPAADYDALFTKLSDQRPAACAFPAGSKQRFQSDPHRYIVGGRDFWSFSPGIPG